MLYVIYNKETTKLLLDPRKHSLLAKRNYKSEAAAKAALTRLVKVYAEHRYEDAIDREDYAIADALTFANEIEKQVTKVNLMSGKEFKQSANTPRCCDPSSELYWSM